MNIQKNILCKLEKSLDTIHPEMGEIPIKILGFGEISLVFELDPKYLETYINNLNEEVKKQLNTQSLLDLKNIAYKRLPIFNNINQIERHIEAYNEYCDILTNEIGLLVPKQDTEWCYGFNKKGIEQKNKITLFCMQKKVDPKSFCNKIIHKINVQQIKNLIHIILLELKKVWDFNLRNKELGNKIIVGIDGQISNWAIKNFKDGDDLKFDKNLKLIYLDTSTPLYRKNNKEMMEPELFLESAPGFLRWVLKLLFLDEVVDRYYDLRSVVIDLLANFYKEQKSEILPEIIEFVNNFFKNEGKSLDFEPISLIELQNYYKNDKKIWVIFQNMRRLDRWLKTKIFRKRYDFYLPEKIKR